MKDLSITQLRSLTAVAAMSSVAGAAAVLGISLPAVTGHIRKLERQVGTTLTTPLGRGITLTADGEVLAERARELLRVHDDTVRELDPPGANDLVVAATEHASQFLVPDILRTTREAFPNSTLRLRLTRSSKARQMLDRERADIAIMLRAPARDSTLVANLPLDWVGVPGAPTDRIVVFDEPCAVRHQAIASLAGRPHSIARECPDLATVLSTVHSGAGVTPLPRMGRRDAPLRIERGLPTIARVPLYLATSARIGPEFKARLLADIRAALDDGDT